MSLLKTMFVCLLIVAFVLAMLALDVLVAP